MNKREVGVRDGGGEERGEIPAANHEGSVSVHSLNSTWKTRRALEGCKEEQSEDGFQVCKGESSLLLQQWAAGDTAVRRRLSRKPITQTSITEVLN